MCLWVHIAAVLPAKILVLIATLAYQLTTNIYLYYLIYVCLCLSQVPVSKFHDLRYNVAYVLKEMGDLEKRNILKVQN